MGLFSRKNKKEVKNKGKHTEEMLKATILKKALKENQEKESRIIDLENNLDFINENLNLIREKCKKSKAKIAEEILKMIGE